MKKRIFRLVLSVMLLGVMLTIGALTAGADDTPEAMWGASKDSLTSSGTLAEAIAAAQKDSNVNYIRLQKSFTAVPQYAIGDGEFTIDLCGCKLEGEFTIFSLRNNAKVTFEDTAQTKGKVSVKNGNAISVLSGAEVIINNGSYEGKSAVNVENSSATINNGTFTTTSQRTIVNCGTLTINNGNFTAGSTSIVFSQPSADGSTIIKGGTFNSGNVTTIEYWDGKLDLSNYQSVRGNTSIIQIRVSAGKDVTPGKDTIVIPDGYCFYADTNVPAETLVFHAGKYYTIDHAPIARWGAEAENLIYGGLPDAAIADVNAGKAAYVQLQSDVRVGSQSGVGNIEKSCTIDLNGCVLEVIVDTARAFAVNDKDAAVTFTDTKQNGAVKANLSDSKTIVIAVGKATVSSGQYEGSGCAFSVGGYSGVEPTLEITGGTFNSGNNIIQNSQYGKVTISGGTFGSAGDNHRCAVWVNGTVTVTGGTFVTGREGIFRYYGGKLDLSGYPTTETTGTTPITDLNVYAGNAVTVSKDTIVLPEGYALYDAENNPVTNLTAGETYTIGKAVIPEAKWGASKDSLTSGGTLEDAIEAACAENSTVKYIQLQKHITDAPEYMIKSGEFTIDLNGCNVEGDGFIFSIWNAGTKVTLEDTAETDGIVTSQAIAVIVQFGAEGLIKGGSYKGVRAVSIIANSSVTIDDGTFTSDTAYAVSNSGTLTINGGNFTSSSAEAIYTSPGPTTINGGTFDSGEYATIRYFRGVLDLSKYNSTADTTPITGLTIWNASELDISDGKTIVLPEGYYLLDADGTPTVSLMQQTTYSIGAVKNAAVTETEDGDVTVTPSVVVTGLSVTITADPVPGKDVDEVKVTYIDENGDEVEVEVEENEDGTYTYIQPDGDVTIDVTFTDTEYDTTEPDVDPADGTVTVSPEDPHYGDEVTITVEPAVGKDVDEVKVTYTDENGEEVEVDVVENEDGTYTYTQPDGNVTIDVTFTDTEYETELPEDGTVTTDPADPTYGEDVTITVEPDPGMEVDEIRVTYTDENGEEVDVDVVENEDGTYTYTQPDANVTIEVTYREVEDDSGMDAFTVAMIALRSQRFPITAAASEGGTITPAGRTYVLYDMRQTYTITPEEGYAVADVLVDGESIGAVSEYTFKRVREAHTISVTFQPVNPYTDVFASDLWYDAVLWLYENGIMNGMDTALFSPDTELSRAMLVTILWRMNGCPVVNYAMQFADVPADEWYTEAVRWAASTGLVNGYSETEFGPADTLTREQLCTILYRYVQNCGDGFTGAWMYRMPHTDLADVSDWAFEAMAWMHMKGIYTGEDNALLPQDYAPRSLVAMMVYAMQK